LQLRHGVTIIGDLIEARAGTFDAATPNFFQLTYTAAEHTAARLFWQEDLSLAISGVAILNSVVLECMRCSISHAQIHAISAEEFVEGFSF